MAGNSNENKSEKPELRPKPRLSQQQLDDLFERRKSLRKISSSTATTEVTTVVTLRRARRAIRPEITVLYSQILILDHCFYSKYLLM